MVEWIEKSWDEMNELVYHLDYFQVLNSKQCFNSLDSWTLARYTGEKGKLTKKVPKTDSWAWTWHIRPVPLVVIIAKYYELVIPQKKEIKE